MDIVSASKRRYTAKQYDATKKIAEEDIKQLCMVLQLCPSSVNSQPWHFIVVSTEAGKAKLLKGVSEFNHDRITAASHIVVFCVKTSFTEERFVELLEQEKRDGRYETSELLKTQDAGRRAFVALNNGSERDLYEWQAKQAYIALGTLLYAASLLNIDSTPIEGFDRVKLDQALNLPERGLTSVVIASLGYHASTDKNATRPKSRLPQEKIFTFL